MSKISDLMDAIRRVISGSDRSDTPQLRKIAATYAGACQEVAARLAECRSLIAAGLLVDAKSIHLSMTPPLAERAVALMLDEEREKEWQKLCRLYGYPEAPALDMETVRRLSGEPGEDGRNSGRLIMRWRKIARSGSNSEKIALLRSIIRAVPENSAIWRDNLRQVEQQFVAELVREVPKAIQSGDARRIMKLFDALSDPELSVKVPDEVFTKLRPVVNMIQREELAAKLKEQLEVITAAYSAMDEIGLREALAIYDELASHPLYAPDMEEKRQIREVRSYLEECRIRTENLKKSELETAELVQLLNDHGSLDRINALFESLRQLGFPLEKNLAERVENRREDDRLEAERRYRRRTLVTILAAILLLMAGAFVVVALNMYSENKNTALAWEKQLEENNPAAVLEMAEKLTREKPRLLKFGKLRKLQMEAERLEEERKENAARVETLLNEAELVIAAKSVDVDEFAQKVTALEKLPENALSPEAGKRLRRLTSALHTMQFEARQNAEKSFTQSFEALSARLSALEKALAAPDSDIQRIQTDAERVFAEMNVLLKANETLAGTLYESRSTAWNERKSAFEAMASEAGEKRDFLKKLTQPLNFTEYSLALESLPVKIPQEAVGAWKTALAEFPMVRALALSAGYGSRWESREKFDDKAREIQAFCRTTPFIEDVRMRLPRRFAEQLSRQRTELDKIFADIPECYELVLEDAGLRRYYFYSPEVPRREKKRSSAMPKSISMDILYKAGSAEAVPLVLRVQELDDDTVFLKPYQFKALPLPEEFVKLVNMAPADPLFPKASYEQVLTDFRNELKNVTAPVMLEEAVLKALKTLEKSSDMNLLLRASLVRNLLDFLPVASGFFADVTVLAAARLDYWALGHYNSWMVPTAVAQFASAPELQKYLDTLNFDNYRAFRALEDELFLTAIDRGVAPAGVVLFRADGSAGIHWFEGTGLCKELWLPVADPSGNSVCFEAWSRAELKDENTLPVQLTGKLTQGRVLFAPFDGQSTAGLADKFIRRARKIGMPKIIWPASWPVNYRTAPESQE